jgi:hypothetical protein
MDIFKRYIQPYACTAAAGAVIYFFAGSAVASVVSSIPIVNSLDGSTRAAISVGVIAAASAPVCSYVQAYV